MATSTLKKSSRIVSLLCLITIICLLSEVEAKSVFRKGSAYCKKRACKYAENILDFDKASVVATFNDTLLVSGWGILDVVAGYAKSGEEQANGDIMFAAGFIEGVLTAEQIEYHYENIYAAFFGNPPDMKLKEKVNKWFVTQREWAEQQIAQHKYDPLWRHASYIFAQLDGLYAGYRSVRGERKDALDMFAMNMLNGAGDLLDMIPVIEDKPVKDWKDMTPDEAKDYFYNLGHCSALIKMLPGYENIFMSHVTWFPYTYTNRIYKHYNFNVNDSATASKKISFSSYPGLLESLDDFYLLGNGMVMLQTTNSILDKSIYKYVKTQALLAWQRVRMASMMAHGGREWTKSISQYNSGTYNNQYMVIDLKLITLNKPLQKNTLWVAEQMPGKVVAQDLTDVLQYGYFPSYNIPIFEEVFNKSGYSAFVEQFGDEYTHQLAPRANIFRRDQSNVTDLESMKLMMSYNDYKNDPYSEGSPWGAICARGDLVGKPSGCYDVKVSDINLARRFEATIISGPTLGTNLPPFAWTGRYANVSHVNLPEIYKFPFFNTKPRFDP